MGRLGLSWDQVGEGRDLGSVLVGVRDQAPGSFTGRGARDSDGEKTRPVYLSGEMINSR